MQLFQISLMVTAISLVACGAESTDDSSNLTSLIATSSEAYGSNCANGGIRIEAGIDSNGSGILDSSEVSSTSYICNGVDGEDYSSDTGMVYCEADRCLIRGQFDRDLTLTADKIWYLQNDVIIGTGNRFIGSEADAEEVINNGVTLTIEPGTLIVPGAYSALIITRGSRIIAEGTAEQPIRFDKTDTRTQWDGLFLFGMAGFENDRDDILRGSCSDAIGFCNIPASRLDSFYFGGNKADDNSGVLSYIRFISHISSDYRYKTLLYLASTGYNTRVDHIDMSEAKRPILAVSGGSTNLDHIVHPEGTIKFDNGYQGNLQYAFAEEISADLNVNITAANLFIREARNIRYNINFNVINSVARPYSSYYYHICDVSSTINTTNVLCYVDEPVPITESAAVSEAFVDPVTDWQVVDNGSGFSFETTDYAGAVDPTVTLENAWWYGWISNNPLTYCIAIGHCDIVE
jgi:hypothetical protein